MNPKILNPFVAGAIEVLHAEIGGTIQRGKLRMETSNTVHFDAIVTIGMTGAVEGTVLYGMESTTAQAIISHMLGQPCEEMDALAQSGIMELGNVITGHASRSLAEEHYQCNITPPLLVMGKEVQVTLPDLPRIAMTLTTSCGEITIHLALRIISQAD